MVSIVIPTFNEQINVIKITNRIKKAFKDTEDYEVIFVDDSTDNTVEYLDTLKKFIV